MRRAFALSPFSVLLMLLMDLWAPTRPRTRDVNPSGAQAEIEGNKDDDEPYLTAGLSQTLICDLLTDYSRSSLIKPVGRSALHLVISSP